jgi:hypothetical protein
MADYKRINGNYTIQTLNTGGQVNLNTSNVSTTGNLSVAGNVIAGIVTAGFFFGDGRFLSNVNVANVAVTATTIANGTSNVGIPIASGNITFGVNSVGNVVVVSSQGVAVTTGTASTSNVTGAVRVTGGVGVTGNVYANAVYSNNDAVLTVNSVINGGTY